MNNKLRPAIIGGLVMGLLSGIPYVSLGNLACCLWVVLGGGLATYLYIRKSPTQVDMGEGALMGFMAGVFGTVVKIIVGLPLTIMAGYPMERSLIGLMERMDPQKAEVYRQGMEYMMGRPFSEQFFASVFSLGTLLWLVITIVFALVGGLLAVPLFEKRKADATPPFPPPPPDYGGTTSGGAYASTPPPPPPADYGSGGSGPGVL
jgi:hypothetical protein